jgi:hypothetical protein
VAEVDGDHGIKKKAATRICRSPVGISLPSALVAVVLEAEVGDEIFPHDVAESVFELRVLNEEIVLGVDALCVLGRLEVEAEPLLNSETTQAGCASSEIHEEDKVEGERSGEDGVAAEEVNLELHRVTEPTEDVDVVPTFFIITAWRVIVNADLVIEILVEIGVQLRLEDVVENAELGLFLGLEGLGIVEHFAVPIAENVRRVPAADTEQTRLEGGGQNGLDEGLAGLKVLAADGSVHLLGKLLQGRDIDGEVGCAVGEGDALFERSPGVEHGGRDVGIVLDETLLEGFEGLVDGSGLDEDFGGASPDHDLPVGLGFELSDVVANLVGEVALVLASLDFLAFETLDVVLVEGCGHGLDGFEEGANLFKLIAIEYLSRFGGVVQVTAEDVPSGKDEIVELRDGGEVLDEGAASVGALAEPDGAHLCRGADGLGKPAANGFYAGDKGGGDCSHTGNHDA